VILAGATNHAILIHRLTSTIPIVSLSAAALQEVGLIENLHRPGGNVTGFDVIGHELMGKRLGLLRQLLPSLKRMGFIESSTSGRPGLENTLRHSQAIGVDVDRVSVNNSGDIAPAFAAMVRNGDQGRFMSPPIRLLPPTAPRSFVPRHKPGYRHFTISACSPPRAV